MISTRKGFQRNSEEITSTTSSPSKKLLLNNISDQALIKEHNSSSMLQTDQLLTHHLQYVEVISQSMAEIEIVEKSCTENRTPPGDSASSFSPLFLFPEKRPFSQITLDVKCCPAAGGVMLVSSIFYSPSVHCQLQMSDS